MTSSVAAVTSNITINTNITTSSRPVTRGATKASCCSDSGVVESDTDTMSYDDDDSSPDHYQPIGSHFSGGVAKDTGRCMAPKNGGVAAKTRPSQYVNSNSNDFPQLSDAGIILSDDPELDKIFASVEVCIFSYCGVQLTCRYIGCGDIIITFGPTTVLCILFLWFYISHVII